MDTQILDTGKKIFEASGEDTGSIFNKDWWYGRIMDWSMKNHDFKVQMFRFVDVLPYLNSSDEVSRHIKEYFQSEGSELPKVLGWGLGLGALAPGIMAYSIKKNVTQMARMFITGENPEEAIKNLRKMRQNGLAFTVDLLGEAAVSEQECEVYQKLYMEMTEALAKEVDTWTPNPQLDEDSDGPISRANLSVKLSSLYSQFDPIDPENSIAAVKERLRPLMRRAKELGVFINIDMESYFHKSLTLKTFKSILEEEEFKNHDNVGIVIQAYLRDSEKDLRELIEWAKNRSGRITVRLVKGAYWDYETVMAQQHGWPIPVFTDKKHTDANYEKLTVMLLENDKHLKAAIGSHNVRSMSHALVQAERLGVAKNSFELQFLYGMADPIQRALVDMGYRVRDYSPVGELIPGMAYLVRRLLENTSNESFLRAKFTTDTSSEELLKNPALNASTEATSETGAPKANHHFANEPVLDFTIDENREKMLKALEDTKPKLGKHYPLVIGKKEVKTTRELKSLNPANQEEVIGSTSMASPSEADEAVSEAQEAQKLWAQKSVDERAKVLEKAAEIMSQRRFELMALEVYETGKTWREADGDIAEAMDFCRYYARLARQVQKPFPVSFVPGEESFYDYKPRGVGVVIAPWNFPLAILCGMTVGTIVVGNSIIMKPAEQSPVVAAWFMDILKEAGLPAGVVNFLPGVGEEVGEYLVNHHGIDFICFTGSREVGLNIIKNAYNTKAGQKGIKKVVAELGGKNALIIDSDADLDEAVGATLYSAFGFQGQKCSAGSRVIVLEDNYDKFIHRLVEGAKSLNIGQPQVPSVKIGPVVDKDAQEKIKGMIAQAKEGGCKVAFEGSVPEGGCFVPPTIFVDVAADAPIAQQEIFGPVLAVIKVKTMDEAIKVANGTDYALTGGLFSRSPGNIDKVKKELEVGNMYINRGITGALVGRHPFGGFKMSGIGSKAGGPEYLHQFMEPVVRTENTVRRGFAPESEDSES